MRPYIKIISDSKREIHFAFTDGYPANDPTNSIYYAKYRDGHFFKASGEFIGSIAALPIPMQSTEIVYDGRYTGIRSWVYDIATDEQGYPIIAYTRLPKETDHRYHYARWNGLIWKDHEITPAWPWFTLTQKKSIEPDPYYSGGIIINPNAPSTVYLSRKIGERFEIEQWVTIDKGKTWSISKKITSNSRHDNVRPIVPRGHHGSEDLLLWMHGEYLHWSRCYTKIWMHPH